MDDCVRCGSEVEGADLLCRQCASADDTPVLAQIQLGDSMSAEFQVGPDASALLKQTVSEMSGMAPMEMFAHCFRSAPEEYKGAMVTELLTTVYQAVGHKVFFESLAEALK